MAKTSPQNNILNSNIIGKDVTPLDLVQNFMYEWKSRENQPKKDGQEGGESKPAEDPIKEILNIIGADVTPMEILQNMCSGQKPTSNCSKTGANDPKPNEPFNNGAKIDPLQTIFNILGGKTCPKSNCSPNSMNPNPDVSDTCCKDSKQDYSECSKTSKPDSQENPKSDSTGDCCKESTQSAEIDPLQAIFSMLGVKSDRQNDVETIPRLSKQQDSKCCSSDSKSSGIKGCDNFFKFEVDVKEFTPEELSVQLVGNSVVVEAKHDEKEDDPGFVSRQFTRRFPIPEGYNLDLIKSTFSTQGILQVQIPKDNVSIERIIPVVRTGPYVI